ncbi:phosphoglycolate phosphatase [Tolypothrix sp. NIES-4075]|uniref:HAD family hydrolase n=1 Tax=Tolypothrix sp. NIES-4075 TaxID=2005459 RepID=UPI000B5C9D19|nr:HAD hydrolase-like protein [Tolypothrix sp. NIES-4075]GAX43014.1 phosphoglycolate phosphatase [Tolypothrix sp. NIES-4075]
MKDLKAIVFDRDGTLLDYSDMFLTFILDIHKSEGVMPPGTETILSLEYWQEIISGKLLIGSVTVREHIDAIPRSYMRLGKFYPRIRETLQMLQQAGLNMTILSGWVGTEATQNFIVQQGLRECFSLIVTCDELEELKIADHQSIGYLSAKKQLLNKTIQFLGVNPDEILVVGDSPEDIEAGKSFNTKTAAVLTGSGHRVQDKLESLKPDAILPTAADLVNLVTFGKQQP